MRPEVWTPAPCPESHQILSLLPGCKEPDSSFCVCFPLFGAIPSSLLEASHRCADAGVDSRAGGLWDPAFPSGHGQLWVRSPERRPEGARQAAGRQHEARPLVFLGRDSLASGKKDSSEKARRHAAALGGIVPLARRGVVLNGAPHRRVAPSRKPEGGVRAEHTRGTEAVATLASFEPRASNKPPGPRHPTPPGAQARPREMRPEARLPGNAGPSPPAPTFRESKEQNPQKSCELSGYTRTDLAIKVLLL
ncbi:unnamed protein product [Rangifer tarandus platyrhynchus]|uniref:Uncharacterized protein n=2 Tax=Rangifer tarandus platyrhynchus TaxID=3082113 RepID=A0ABN8ZIM9_RANTA|nr:unnamed protein product [Rangifer tarandus platyrhynchus]CAI9708296.1 unnamed protein product [Rangifer tarandus platyrhynchus]